MDYEIIEEKNGEVYLREIDNNRKETKQKEPETKELTLIKVKKGEEIQDAEVFISYIKDISEKRIEDIAKIFIEKGLNNSQKQNLAIEI